MPLNKNIRVCTHIKVNGVPCGSPALRGEVFCYFHQRMIRGVRTPAKSRLHPIALIENEEGIQASLMEVINALVRNTIDFRRAQLILRALHIAVKNSPRVHFNIYKERNDPRGSQLPRPTRCPKATFVRHHPGWRTRANPAPQAHQHHPPTAADRRRAIPARSPQTTRTRQARVAAPQPRAPPLGMKTPPRAHNGSAIIVCNAGWVFAPRSPAVPEERFSPRYRLH